MARETAHERVCTFLVSSDKAQASANEIREALESSDDEAKVEALETAIACLLAGEQLPSLFITIVRYVLPSENHQVQKLLLLYLVSDVELWWNENGMIISMCIVLRAAVPKCAS